MTPTIFSLLLELAELCKRAAMASENTRLLSAEYQSLCELRRLTPDKFPPPGYRFSPVTTMSTARLPHCEQTSRACQSGSVTSAP
jgi:hypothetical protein